MRTFIFAIGGTGARVLRSLMMLIASDIDLNNEEIIPLCIDLDDNNGDLDRSLTLLRKYRDLKNRVSSESFYKNKVGTLGSLQSLTNEAAAGISDNFKLNFGNITETFNNYISGPALDHIDQQFLELLYDSSVKQNPNTELNLTLDKGFKGNPNIGCVVFNDIIETNEFKYFENVFTGGDKIFIISSIFGGTGSSGFPQLVENIKKSNNTHVANAPLGALVVKPYFKVTQDPNSTINSDLFNSKTKAALNYYSSHLTGLSDIFYIGDTAIDPYENIMGGSEQKNKAHMVEWLGAKSILKFLNYTSYNPNDTRYHEYGIENLAPNLSLNRQHFFANGDAAFWKSFTKYSIFCKAHKHILSDFDTFMQFFRNIEMSQNDFRNLNDLNTLVDEFLKWMGEMRENRTSLDLFDLSSNDNMDSFVKGKVETGLNAMKSRDILRALILISNQSTGTSLERYISSINELIETHYSTLINV